jgi:hypothetical protein
MPPRQVASKMLKLYTDKAFLPANRSGAAILYPFWGVPALDAQHPEHGRFDAYARVGGQFLQLTCLEDAALGVFPIEWEQPARDPLNTRLAREFVARAAGASKPCVIFCYGDFDEPLAFPDAIVYRTTLYRTRRQVNERAMPAWCVDLLQAESGGELTLRPKRTKPVVSFCGQVPPFTYDSSSVRERLWRLRLQGNRFRQGLVSDRQLAAALELARSEPGYAARKRALDYLAADPRIETNFILRHAYFGGAVRRGSFDLASGQRVRREYTRNIVESDYVLCARGGGNFSFRLYETLSLGRIPVFVDTDCVLPEEGDIHWRDYVVWVKETELAQIGDKVLEFHAGLSEPQFHELQKNCRSLWETRLSPQGFFANLHRHFD